MTDILCYSTLWYSAVTGGWFLQWFSCGYDITPCDVIHTKSGNLGEFYIILPLPAWENLDMYTWDWPNWNRSLGFSFSPNKPFTPGSKSHSPHIMHVFAPPSPSLLWSNFVPAHQYWPLCPVLMIAVLSVHHTLSSLCHRADEISSLGTASQRESPSQQTAVV